MVRDAATGRSVAAGSAQAAAMRALPFAHRRLPPAAATETDAAPMRTAARVEPGALRMRAARRLRADGRRSAEPMLEGALAVPLREQAFEGQEFVACIQRAKRLGFERVDDVAA